MGGKLHEFTDEEIKYIIEHWGKESPYSMKKRFDCTQYAVCKVAEKADLEIPESNKWTTEQIEILKDLSDKCHYSEIATILDKAENVIYLKAKRLGITLMDFLEKNQNKWDSRNLEENMLGFEPDWLKEKRMRYTLEDPLWYRC